MILPIAALLAALVAVPAAQAKVKVGLSEQNPAMFDQPSWQQLKLKRVRYIVSWDYAKQPFEHAEVTGFMNAARAHKQEVLVTFNAHRGCFVNNKYREDEGVQGAERQGLQGRGQGLPQAVPVRQGVRAVERGQPRLPADVPASRSWRPGTTRP